MKQIIIDKETEQELSKLLSRHGSYRNFSRCKTDAYKFVKLIEIRICPYCNINHVYAVFDKQKRGLVRPDLDHFLSKADNTTKSMDWHNLIPACQQCNSRLKGRKKFKANTHIHPYDDDFDSIERIAISINTTDYLDDNFDIVFIHKDFAKSALNKKAEGNIRDFRLEERYQYHKTDVISIFRKIQIYHRQRLKELSNLLGNKNDLWSILFEDENCDINQTSLGKLKRDVIQQYR